MKNSSAFDSTNSAAPNGPETDRQVAFARILGQSDAERIEQHILTMRRFTELGLLAAERLHEQQEEVRAEARREPNDAAAAEPKEVSEALYRLARLARLNIALEQKLVEDLRNPGPAAPSGKREQRQRPKQAEQDAHLARQKADVENWVENKAATDKSIDRERFDELLAELRREFDSGRLDEKLLSQDFRTVGYMFLWDRKIYPDWQRLFDDEIAARARGMPDPTYPPPPHIAAAPAASGKGAPAPSSAAEPDPAAPEPAAESSAAKPRPP
jgi:hypothetical protein